MGLHAKEKKIFALSNFRGLDKENKPLKVASFRATDGSNFVIDSSTLKTRPAIKAKKEIPFFLDVEDYLIDWYEYGGVAIYVTKKHFYFSFDNVCFNEKIPFGIADTRPIISKLFNDLNFEGKRPLFQEEKDALFIFGLNEIYVFSIVRNQDSAIDKLVFYALNAKPINPFDPVTNAIKYRFFDDLPKAYEPTLFIGKSVYEDVNLLSNVTKYKLFANSIDTQEDTGKTTYELPTTYNSEKNGTFTKEIVFYDDKFLGFNSIPVFLGTVGQDFDDIASFGDVLNATSHIEIKETFRPEKDFEYKGGVDEVGHAIISEIVGVKKQDFFKMHTKDTNIKVFEHIMDYIVLNPSALSENKLYIFDLNIEYNAVYYTLDTNIVFLREKKRKTVPIYVQLKRYEKDDIFFESENVLSNVSLNSTDDEIYPAFQVSGKPDFGSNMATTTFSVNAINEFTTKARQFLMAEKTSFTQNTSISVKGKMFKKKTTFYPDSIVFNMYYQDYLSNVVYDKMPLIGNFPAYPNIQGATNYFDFSTTSWLTIYGKVVSLNEDAIYNFLRPKILAEMQKTAAPFSQQSGTVYAKFRLVNEYFENDMTYTDLRSVIIPFTYEKSKEVTTKDKYSLVYECDITREKQEVTEGMYEFKVKEEKGCFELNVKNYFFDYNDEPSIEVKIIFEKNPNYDLISNTGFGITFGSENRLFLAGNKNFPHIDRFNVSNDLLGNNVKNQSYELSYFPSKNYRVLGGKGAINGYVVATDNQLYITKEKYPNDSNLFVRERTMGDDGIVGYNEYKTSVKRTPLNERCIVRFYNDILMLTESGLFAIELSSNLLTDEKLQKMRSSFINTDLVNCIKSAENDEIFIVENNEYMYIFIGKNIYVADSRYMGKDENGVIDNQNYEIVKWNSKLIFSGAKTIEQKVILNEKGGNFLYEFCPSHFDDKFSKKKDVLSTHLMDTFKNVFQVSGDLNYIFEDAKRYSFKLYEGYKCFARNRPYGQEFSIVDNKIYVENQVNFRDIQDGDVLFFKNQSNVFKPFVVNNFEKNNRVFFETEMPTDCVYSDMFVSAKNIPLYITHIIDYKTTIPVIYFKLDFYKPDLIHVVSMQQSGFENESEIEFQQRAVSSLDVHNDFYFSTVDSMRDLIINEENYINIWWLSSIIDFGNNMSEKTMFRVNFYATKMIENNIMKFGYRTTRKLARIDDEKGTQFSKKIGMIDLANTSDFSEFNFNSFSFSTFSETGMSFPVKESNFLYIQFLVAGVGQIELNSIKIIYKDNRLLKTIG